MLYNQKGQLLIELLIAITIAALIAGAISGLFFVNFRSSQSSENKNSALLLAQEAMEAIDSIKNNSWHKIYLPPDGTGDANNDKGVPYYIYNDGSIWKIAKVISSTDDDIVINETVYSRSLYIYNASRDNNGNITEIGGSDDPSTQKIKVVVSYEGGKDVILEEYLTRWKNEVFNQSDWSGGPGQAGPISPTPNAQYDSDSGNVDTNNPTGSIRLKP